MKYLVGLVILVIVEAKTRIYITDGPIQKIGGRYYRYELLTNNFYSPKELAYDPASRNLYFMYMDDDIGNSGRAAINVVTKRAMKIKGIKRNKATAVNPDTGEVYFGSDDGLYKYDPVTNTAKNTGLYNINIMKLVIRNNEMFLIDANNHMIYKAFDEGSRLVQLGNAKKVVTFEVDNDRNVHYVTLCGVYCAVNGQEVVQNKDLSIVYNLIVDKEKTYGVLDDNIYEIDCKNGTATIITDLGFFPSSLIFGDYGDIFYSIDDNIVKLTPISSYVIYNLHGRT